MAGNHRKRGGKGGWVLVGTLLIIFVTAIFVCWFNGMQDWFLFELGFTYLLLAAYAI